MPKFSIVVPVYRNEANLRDTLRRLLDLKAALTAYEVELVFVDDGSDDRSPELLDEMAAANPETVRVVRLTRNFGQTAATQAGLHYAEGDCVGIISADLQEPCEAFVDMVRAWEGGAKFVIGERESREESWRHRALSGIYWKIARLAFPDYPKLGYDFCVLDRQVADAVNRINEKNSSIFMLIYWLGFRPIRLPVARRLREKGRSQWRFWQKVGITFDTLIGFTYLPARLITAIGLSASILCLAYLSVLLVVWWRSQDVPEGWMTLFGLLSLLGSVVLFSLGIASEYLLRILDEARRRPPFVVDSVRQKKPARGKVGLPG